MSINTKQQHSSGSCLAYIGPGMLYLAVHGGRFLELADDFFRVPNEGTNENEHPVASETTTLVGNPQSEAGGCPRILDGCCKTVMWYLGGMPLWCNIAETGKKRVMAHAQSLAAKNTVEYNRIGGVDYTGIEKLASDSIGHATAGLIHTTKASGAAATHLMRSNPDLKALNQTALTEHIDIERKFAANTKKSLPSLEPDPQEKPPAWLDFFIAVFYICFGVVALFAGLVSLADNGSSE